MRRVALGPYPRTIMLVLLLGTLSACSGGTTSAPSTTSLPAPRPGPCPSPFVVQTDQEPNADLGFLYALFDGAVSIDPQRRAVYGAIASPKSELDGTMLEIRHGGAVTDFDLTTTIMHADASVTAGLVSTDEAILTSARHGTMAVFTAFHTSPTIVFWDPDAYPGRTSIDQFKNWDISLVHASGAPFMEHLVSTGVLHAKQSVPTSDGTPVSYMASGGRMLHQGSATLDPHAYRHVYRDWMKEIEFQYVHDMGWDPYAWSFAVRSDDVEPLAACLALLVPELQRVSQGFLGEPGPAIDRIVETARRFGGDWLYDADQARAAVARIIDDELWTFPMGTTHGGFDADRIDRLVAKARASHSTPGDIAPGLSSIDIATDRFLDPSILSVRSRSD